MARILFLTSGRNEPSSRFRVQQYVPHLRRMGHTCIVAPAHPPKYRSFRWLGWRLSIRLRRLLRWLDWLKLRLRACDVVVIERELFDDATSDVEQRIRESCRTMVLDVDDALFLRNPAKFDALCRMCDAVIAGNQLLAERIRPHNPRVTVIPTCVDLERYRVLERPADSAQRPVVGWTGTSATLEFLKPLAAPLQALRRERPFTLRTISDDPDAAARLGLATGDVECRPWNKRSEIADLSTFDIGLMPLPDTEWTRYKCGLKIIQYLAVGTPAVASPVGVNGEIIRHGQNGFLADSADEWLSVLRRLIDEPRLRQELGRAGRRTVEDRYSIQKHVPTFLAVLESAGNR